MLSVSLHSGSEFGPVALSLGHRSIFSSSADSPTSKAGSVLFTNIKQHHFGKWEKGGKQRCCRKCFLQVVHPPRRATGGIACPWELSLLCIAGHCTKCRAPHKRLEEHAGLESLLLWLGPSHLNWARCKLKVCGWEFSASTTVLAEKHVGRKIRRLTPEELRAWMWPP